MSTIYNELDEATKSLYIKRIDNELDDLDENDERYIKLCQIKEKLITPKVSTFNATLNQININAFQKSWNHLHNFHKLVKIKEYIEEEYHDYDTGLQKKIEKCLVDAVESGELNSNRLVTYDKDRSIIVDIPCLTVKNNEVFLKLPKKYKGINK